jgi:hypothetical protein
VLTLILTARLLLAAIFGFAGIAKLAAPSGARRAVVAFGVPEAAAAIVARTVVAAEFVVVALLLTARGYGALAALTMLTGFSAAVLVSLARGRVLECHCFGRLSTGQIGWPTLARNACFAGLATFVALDGRFAWILTAFTITMLTLWTGPTLYRRWAPRADTTAAGRAAERALPDRAGNSWTTEKLLDGQQALLLVFSQPGCGACEELLPEVDKWQRNERFAVALVNGGSANHGVPLELFDQQRAWFAAYDITATPSAVLIDRDGNLVSAPARGAGAIRKLVERAAQVSEANRFNRRGLLGRAAVGLTSAGALSAAACDSSAKHTETDALDVDGAWLCNQTFALCTTAPCTPSTTDPAISVCDCVVVNGYSVGFKPCPERAQSGTKVRSAFSTVNVNANFGVLSCPSGVPWANCLDVECEIDPRNPAVAKCQCLTVKTGESLTFGGGCDKATCNSTIWSAATPDLPATTQYRKGMKQLGQPMVDFPKTCPAPK